MAQAIDIETLCHEKGLRVTEQRRVIARVLSDASDHPDVEALHARAVAVAPGISIATVYRTVRRSAVSRVGKECVRTCSYRWAPYTITVTKINIIELIDDTYSNKHMD